MPVPFRTALGQALLARLAGAASLDGYTIERARRDDVPDEARPLICIDVTGDAAADNTAAPCQTLWTIGITVVGYPVAAASEVACSDALAQLEADLIAAIEAEGARLDLGGLPLCEDVQVRSSSADAYPVEDSSDHLGEVTITVAATLWLVAGQTSIP